MNWKPGTFREEVISLRRELHRHAERGWEEFWTSAFVASRLEELGFGVLLGGEVIDAGTAMGRPSPEELERARLRAMDWGAEPAMLKRLGSFTGVVATLETGAPGPVTAFRFDMDAVEVDESKDQGHRPFCQGFSALGDVVMHACGHDGHTAIGLTFARWLQENRKNLKGTFKLFFQPAEEGVRGGLPMAEKGLLDDVDTLLGFHLGVGTPSGTVKSGCSDFLCTTKLDVLFRGIAAHAGGAPDEGRNALLAAATAVLGIHGIAPHRDGPSRVNVGVLQAGTGRNVVPALAEMRLETRGQTEAINDYVYQRSLEVLEGAAKAQGVELEMSLAGAAVNAESHPALMNLVGKVALTVDGIDHVEAVGTVHGSEDISWMMRRVTERGGRACYFILGADIAAGHHNGRFDFDEEVLPQGVVLLVEVTYALAGLRRD